MADAEKRRWPSGANRAKAIDAVRDYFYRGEIAHRIDAFIQGPQRPAALRGHGRLPRRARGAGLHHLQGLHGLQARLLEPGPGMIEALNILEGYDIPALKLNSAEYIHTLVEALKLAYADRDTYYGDPKFNKIPTETLLSKEYAAERRKLIANRPRWSSAPARSATSRRSIRSTPRSSATRSPDALMAKDTTCVDAIDKDGMAILGHALGRVDAHVHRRRHRHSAHAARAELPAGAAAIPTNSPPASARA